MSKNPVNAVTLGLLEKEVAYFGNTVVRNLKNNINWIETCLEALYHDIGVKIDLEERLGFSPRRLLKNERARSYRAVASIATIKAGEDKSPQCVMGGISRSLQTGRARIDDAVNRIQSLYYELEEEYSDELEKLGDRR